MEIAPDAWLGAILERAVFRVDVRPTDVSDVHGASVADDIFRHASRHPGGMYFAKAETAAVNVVRALTSAGFYVVDVSLTLGLDTGTLQPPASLGRLAAACTVAEVGPEQHAAVLDIARTCFRFSRFHLDPLLSREKAHQVKHDWILSYLRRERGDRLLVASSAGRPVGFLAAMRTNAKGRKAAVIDLIGVSPACQQRGIGHALVTDFISRYKGSCERLQVGTQAANVPSLRLYERLGFSILKTQYVFHMHVPLSGATARVARAPAEARWER